ncbi:MAG: deoxyribodipyrimidine photo-lyase [Bernardetiaceae bacterium]|nr:deoxyribodipyrimidine photo-lyase [Bernardetiaceae bacterium]
MPDKKVNILWWKRDLRLTDHQPLKEAIETGLPLLPIYIFEPSLKAHPDWGIRHWLFAYHSLLEMQKNLEKAGHTLYIFYEEAEAVFEYLYENFDIQKVYSHQETGITLSYKRDLEIAQWLKTRKIDWQEYPSNGIVRPYKGKKDWQQTWIARMQSPQQQPDLSALKVAHCEVPVPFLFDYATMKSLKFYPKHWQPPGEENASRYLKRFFQKGVKMYMQHISKAEAARSSCSRISPYLAWGNLSTRQVYQAYQKEKTKTKYPKNLKQFRSRLQWRCHFMQRFEQDTSLETQAQAPRFETLEQPKNEKWLRAWKEGKTGYPLVDAAMRCLCETGYLNFRMRAMLVSFLTHQLWQPWQLGAHFLASQFLDYEPGIHYAQFQMQAGVTGMHTIRMYNPIKQAKDNDPEAVFIKKWIPELRNLPVGLAQEPYKMSQLDQAFYHCYIGKDYPAPIIDIKEASQKAKILLWEKRKQQEF